MAELGSQPREAFTDHSPDRQHLSIGNMNVKDLTVTQTVVDAFIRMTVCRKVKVQTVALVDGRILKSSETQEEEEPVILNISHQQTSKLSSHSSLQLEPVTSADTGSNSTEHRVSGAGSEGDAGSAECSSRNNRKEDSTRREAGEVGIHGVNKVESQNDANEVESTGHTTIYLNNEEGMQLTSTGNTATETTDTDTAGPGVETNTGGADTSVSDFSHHSRGWAATEGSQNTTSVHQLDLASGAKPSSTKGETPAHDDRSSLVNMQAYKENSAKDVELNSSDTKDNIFDAEMITEDERHTQTIQTDHASAVTSEGSPDIDEELPESVRSSADEEMSTSSVDNRSQSALSSKQLDPFAHLFECSFPPLNEAPKKSVSHQSPSDIKDRSCDHNTMQSEESVHGNTTVVSSVSALRLSSVKDPHNSSRQPDQHRMPFDAQFPGGNRASKGALENETVKSNQQPSVKEEPDDDCMITAAFIKPSRPQATSQRRHPPQPVPACERSGLNTNRQLVGLQSDVEAMQASVAGTRTIVAAAPSESSERIVAGQLLRPSNTQFYPSAPYLKKFRCNICGKAFKRKSHLAVHIKFHMGVRRYQCDVCQSSYVQRGDLLRHFRTSAHKEKVGTAQTSEGSNVSDLDQQQMDQ